MLRFRNRNIRYSKTTDSTSVEEAVKRARLLILASTMAMVGWGRCCRTSTPTPRTPAAGAASSPPRRRACSRSVPCSPPRSAGGWPTGSPRCGSPWRPRWSPPPAPATSSSPARPAAFLAGMFVFGVGITAAAPAQSVLVLRWVASADRRRVFAWQFTGQALGMAVGAFAAGYMVNLARATGCGRPSPPRGGFVVSACLLLLRRRAAPRMRRAAEGRRPRPGDRQRRGDPADLRHPGAALDGGRHHRPRARASTPSSRAGCPPTP